MLTSLEKTMLGFVIIYLSSALWPNLPHYSLIAFATTVLVMSLYFRFSSLINGLTLGFLWASVSIHYYLNAQIDTHKFNQNVIVVGEVDSLIHRNTDDPDQRNTKFNFIVHQIGTDKEWLQPKIRLSWYKPSIPLHQGQQLRLFVRLKAPIGLANPQGFNYQTWLASQNIAGTGYVKESPSNQLLNNHKRFRQSSVDQLLAQQTKHLAWILALSYGDRSLLSQNDWELMQNTGTAHLFAISGMHLGIVFGFVFFTLKLFLYLPTKYANEQFNNTPILLFFACCVCVFYAYIAGFQVPVMRALFAVLLWSTIRGLQLYWRSNSLFLLLLVCFFVIFPYAHLSLSFWFSFTAVILIWGIIWRFPLISNELTVTENTFSKLKQNTMYGVKLQFFLSVFTLPIIVSVFAILPFTSFFSNLFMIPIVTFVMVPLCLINAILLVFDINIWLLPRLLDYLFEAVLLGLRQISTLGSFSLETWSVSIVLLVGTYAMLIVLLLPTSQYRIKSIASVCFILASFCVYLSNRTLPEQWEILAFDVGQGSSIVVRQHQHFLIYDTGAAFKGGFSMAQAVLTPYFEKQGLPNIDYLILSHLDNDHAGGARYLQNNMAINQILSPNSGCHMHKTKQWHTLQMQILWPLAPQSGNENNHSCVLKLSSAYFSVLLVGDIEKSAEAAIINEYRKGSALQADILVAPHHGSKTSSTTAFIEAVAPTYVIFTAGYNNRWGFPDKTVEERYQKSGAISLNTGLNGRIKIQMLQDKMQVLRYRQDEYSRWYFVAKDFKLSTPDKK